MPSEANGTGAKAAKAFAKFWIESLNNATQSGRTDMVRATSTPDCVACMAIADAIDRVYRNGGFIRGSGWSPLATRLVQQNSGQTVIDVLVMVHKQTVVEAKGDAPKRFSGGRRLKTLTMVMGDNGWRVVKLEQST